MEKEIIELNETKDKQIIEKWFEEASEIKTTEELSKFINHLIEDYKHDYGTIVHAISAAMVGAFSVINNSKQGGITGFQAGAIGWRMVRTFFSIEEDVPVRIISYDELLNPYCKHNFTEIPSRIWEWVKQQAAKRLSEEKNVGPEIIDHWTSIVNGKVPFGLSISKR